MFTIVSLTSISDEISLNSLKIITPSWPIIVLAKLETCESVGLSLDILKYM